MESSFFLPQVAMLLSSFVALFYLLFFKRGSRKPFGRSNFSNRPLLYKIAGITLSCSQCKNYRWYKREAILPTSYVAFLFGVFWNRSSTCYTCTRCGHCELFLWEDSKEFHFLKQENKELESTSEMEPQQ